MALRTLASALLFLTVLGARPLGAQGLSLALADGRVTLHADGVTAQQILAEWARQAQVQIVGAERLAPERLTLQLDNIAEAEALDIVLRQASGYILAPRPAGVPGRSTIDRILILPVSVASAAPAGMRAMPPPLMPPPVQQPDPSGQPPVLPGAADETQNGQPQDFDPNGPPFQPPQPMGSGTPPPAPPPPFSVPLAPGTPSGEGAAPTGPVIVARPGVLPVPQQQQPQQPPQQPPSGPPSTSPSPPQ